MYLDDHDYAFLAILERAEVWSTLPVECNKVALEEEGLIELVTGVWRLTDYAMSDGKIVPAQALSMTQAHAAGGLASNVDDLLAWNRALHAGRVLKHASYLQMITPIGKAATQHYGFGMVHDTLRGTDMLQHGGSIFGTNSYLLYLPKHKVTVAVHSAYSCCAMGNE